jgi:hypothetical protein
MANTVLTRVLRKNQYDYPADCVHSEGIPCTAQPEVTGWYIPNIAGGRLNSYDFRIGSETVKPQPDAIKVLRLRDRQNGNVYFIPIADAANGQLFNDACNACCEAVAPLAAVTIPVPQIEVTACWDQATGKYLVYTYAVPLSGALVYKPRGSQNNVYFTPASPGGGFATVALFITWANTNWSAYGVWSNVGQMVKLSVNTALDTWIDMNPS